MNATAASTLQVITDTHPCACGGYQAVAADGATSRTGCSAVTKRTFAPGHDARLKGFLIRAGAQGLLIRTPVGGDDQAPVKVAERFGFGHMVAKGIAAAKARAFTKALKGAKKAPKATPAPAATEVAAKVGRWEYEGTLSADHTEFTFTDRKGAEHTVAKFTLA
jgi:hypothetical protein